ncbi:hypothetical protein LX99_00436 [Mucilaginibacter oryzae]|uniref:Uncharacterized protein n=1 Tax=Mucilaginibacter oryzae TaxID=468058 RepID=A0A316HP31_9SPHI|nr:DUF6169 family protein [Mucilaginibacter oryzae]PWK79975.1 hypothetical protein LX99_00436 [Mucilaginibacter oryzae]
MYDRYSVEFDEGEEYRFTTSSGDLYIAYFTEFVLLDPSGTEIKVLSFGFTRKQAIETKKRYDSKVKHTIVFIINHFFEKQPDDAVLYMCMTNDGKARNRNVTFNNWYHELNSNLEKHSSSSELGRGGFYASILFKVNNPNKRRLISSFYFTIDYWGLNDY